MLRSKPYFIIYDYLTTLLSSINNNTTLYLPIIIRSNAILSLRTEGTRTRNEYLLY